MKLSHVRTSLLAATFVAALLLPAARAGASATQVTIMQDDTEVVAASDSHRQSILDEMSALGAEVVKIRIDWRDVAPHERPAGFDATDPSQYPSENWRRYDDSLREIVARGMRPYVMLGGRAPDWASGHDAIDRPNAKELGKFAQAVGRRYSGQSGYTDPLTALPRVTIWSVWNEPNLASWLKPQYSHDVPVAPKIYRNMLYAVRDGLVASGHGSDELLIGELLPFARSGRTGSVKIRPVAFLRELACLDSHYKAFKGSTAKKRGCQSFKPIPGSGLAYHPYTLAGGPDVRSPNGDDASIGELGRITRALDALSRRGRLESSRMPVWITEFGFQTDPPDIYQSPIKKVPGFMGEAEWIAFRNPRVMSYAQYPLVDDALSKGRNKYGGFQSGLRTEKGKRKPGVYAAFKLALFVQRRSSSVVEVFGGVRAGAPGQDVTVQSRTGSKAKWRTLSGGKLKLGERGYFDRVFQLSGATKRQYRYVWSGHSSRAAGVHG